MAVTQITLASADVYGFSPNGDPRAGSGSRSASLSADGRFVAFDSDTNLFGGESYGATNHVFLKDLLTSELKPVSLGTDGSHVPGFNAKISADGQVVAYHGSSGLLVYNVQTGVTQQVESTG